MLVLTRKLGEVITIGDDVRITVVNIEGNQVKIGIDAPKQVKVHRAEIFDRIKQENIDAVQSPSHRVIDLARAFQHQIMRANHESAK